MSVLLLLLHAASCGIHAGCTLRPGSSCQVLPAATPSISAGAVGQEQEPPGQAAAVPAAVADHASGSQHSGSSNSSSADWDASDDWEPDVSTLRSASSFTKQQEKTVVLQPFQSTPHPQRRSSGSPPQPTRFAISEPAHSVRASSGGGSSNIGSSAGGSRPRGRGQSKCGLPTSDSEDEALLAAGMGVDLQMGRTALGVFAIASCCRS